VPSSLTDLAGLQVSAEEFLAAMLETAAQPIWAVDPDGLIRFANPAAIAALGYDDADQLVGLHSHETIHYKHPDGTPYPAKDCPLLLPRATGRKVSSDLDWFVRRDGSMFPVSYVSVPLEMAEGRGAVVTFTDIEDRMRAEQALREHDAALAAQQASLRRVATLVARGASSADVFAAIAREVAQVLGLRLVSIWRYEPDGTGTVLGASSDRAHPFEPGSRWPLDSPTVSVRVKQTGRPTKIDDYSDIPGTLAQTLCKAGITSGAGAPIVVDGRVWGAIVAYGKDHELLPDHIEDRLAEFTDLIAAAFSNTARGDQLARIADEQAALRRVATLVARGVSPSDLFGAVTEEVGGLLGTDGAGMLRYAPADAMTHVASWGAGSEHLEPGSEWPLEGGSLGPAIFETGRSARIDDWRDASGPLAAFVRDALGFRSSVGSPIVVEGRAWGAVVVHSKQTRPLPVDTEARLENFTELVATAISNAQARAEVRRLADEQAALRRVATLVAREPSPADVFAGVAREVGRLLRLEDLGLLRYEGDGTATIVANWGHRGVEIDSRLPLGGDNISSQVHRTRRPARIDDYTTASGPMAAYGRELGWRSAVGTPIVVEGRLWGAMIAASQDPAPLPTDTEARLAEFTALVATAVSNIQARSDLAASRARIVAAIDDERRRVVRDLHDGAQQRMVHTVITLRMADRALRSGDETAPAFVSEALEQAQQATEELRELAHGILPAVLTRGGLRAGVELLASRTPVPVEIAVTVGRLPPAVEATAYFVVSEALTNVAKHSRAERAEVTARTDRGALRVSVRDNGVGGARPDGDGLLGLRDRLDTLDGTLRVESPAGAGTLIVATIPVPG
jgi:PAS domain S-box-containing protein